MPRALSRGSRAAEGVGVQEVGDKGRQSEQVTAGSSRLKWIPSLETGLPTLCALRQDCPPLSAWLQEAS